MKRQSIPRQGDSRWTITSGARALPASSDLPAASDLPPRRRMQTRVRQRYYEQTREHLVPLSRRPAFRDN